MRFDRIDLTRFGHFTDFTIDLGSPTCAGDFHIIYGPNEAGKSTLRDACIDFLYGIPNRTKYGFIHDYAVMEVGACITATGTRYEAKRGKGKHNTLISCGESVLSEAALNSILGGISRESYEHMYALNDHSLEAGGESILASEGDLGSLLFGAMSGLPDINSALAKAKTQTEVFFRAAARNTGLNQLKNELKELDQAIKDNDVDAAKYARLQSDARQAQKQWQEKKTERDTKLAEQRQLQALIAAHPVWQEYLHTQQDLAPLQHAPEVPTGWPDEVNRLISQHAEARSKAETESHALARAQQQRDAIASDETALALAEQVRRLQQDDLEARYKTSFDIELVQAQRQRLQETIEDHLRALGQPLDSDPRQLLLAVSTLAQIRALMSKANSIDADLKAAVNEWHNANSELEAAEQELAQLPIPDQQPAALQAALERAQAAPKPEQLETLAATVTRARRERDDLLAKLSPWQGDSSTLQQLPLPDVESLQRLQTQDSQLKESARILASDTQQLLDSLAQQTCIINSLIEEAKVISDAAADSVRQARDAAWVLHRDALNQTPLPRAQQLQQSADAFIAALLAHDQMLLTRFTQTTDLARLREAQLERASIEARLGRQEEKQQLHNTALHAHRQALQILFDHLRLPADFELSRLSLWLEHYRQALKADVDLNDLETEQQKQLDAFHAASTLLQEALHRHGFSLEHKTWQQQLQLGQHTIDNWQQLQQQRAQLQQSHGKAEKEASRRTQQREKAEREKAQWTQSWSCVLDATWLGQHTPEAVAAMLATLDSLESTTRESHQLDDKIAAMADDRKRYCAEVQRLAQLAAAPFDAANPLATADLLRDRINRAQAAQQSQQQAEKDITEAQARLDFASDQIEHIDQRFETLRQIIPADNLERLREKINQGLARAGLQTRAMELTRDIKRLLNQEHIETGLALLQEKAGTPDQLEAIQSRCQALNSDLIHIEDQVSQLYADWQQLARQLQSLGCDATVAKLVEQRQALLLQIEAEAHQFMRLSSGIMLANEALRRYRESHRSSMMQAANNAFQRITRGAFKGLETATQDDRELLFGKRNDGSTILASEMSRGTRFQLYLALRIAGHAELARNGETLPFFADDILEPFDDDRSLETFALLHAMAKQGQVVYLTHHRHLCELAQEITNGEVRVHELPGKQFRANR